MKKFISLLFCLLFTQKSLTHRQKTTTAPFYYTESSQLALPKKRGVGKKIGKIIGKTFLYGSFCCAGILIGGFLGTLGGVYIDCFFTQKTVSHGLTGLAGFFLGSTIGATAGGIGGVAIGAKIVKNKKPKEYLELEEPGNKRRKKSKRKNYSRY